MLGNTGWQSTRVKLADFWGCLAWPGPTRPVAAHSKPEVFLLNRSTWLRIPQYWWANHPHILWDWFLYCPGIILPQCRVFLNCLYRRSLLRCEIQHFRKVREVIRCSCLIDLLSSHFHTFLTFTRPQLQLAWTIKSCQHLCYYDLSS